MSASTITATHEQGATRRLAHLVARKAGLGVVLTLVAQNFIHLPAWMAVATPVATVLGLHVGA